MEHVLDGALAHAAAVFGLAVVAGPAVWRWATGEDRPGSGRVGAALLSAAVLLLLVVIVAVAEGPIVVALTTVMTRTAYGASLGAFAGCAAVAVIARRPGLRLAAVAGAAGALARMGHAGADGGGVVATVHVFAAVVWLGGLLVAARSDTLVARRFGRVAIVCVGLLVVSGCVRAGGLLAAGWGRSGSEEAVAWIAALAMKLAAVGVALVCAWRVRRAVREGRPAPIEAELGAVGVVVLLGALMGRMATP